MTAPLDDPLRRVADMPPPVAQAATTRTAVPPGQPPAEKPPAEKQPSEQQAAGQQAGGQQAGGQQAGGQQAGGQQAEQQAAAGAGQPAAEQATAGQPAGAPSRAVGVDRPAGHASGTVLTDLLDQVFEHEPSVGDAVAEIFRRAGVVRRRRARRLVTVGSAVIVLITVLGYGLTTVLLPASPTQHPAAETVPGPARIDPVLAALNPVLRAVRVTAVPKEPSHGVGWRRYLALTRDGRPDGLIEVSVYARSRRLCFPVRGAGAACALPLRAAGNVDYARYGAEQDADRQVNEVIAQLGGRVIVVQATAERAAGGAPAGSPPLSAAAAAQAATDPMLAVAFTPGEACEGPGAGCPILAVPVPPTG